MVFIEKEPVDDLCNSCLSREKIDVYTVKIGSKSSSTNINLCTDCLDDLHFSIKALNRKGRV